VSVRVTARPVPGRARPTTRAGSRPRTDLAARCRPTCGSGRRCRRMSRRSPARPRSRSRFSRTTSPPRPRPARPRRFRTSPRRPPPGPAPPPRPRRRPLLLRPRRFRLRRHRPLLLRRLRRLRPRPPGYPRPARAPLRARVEAVARACPRQAAALLTFRAPVPGARVTRVSACPRPGRGVLRPGTVVSKAPRLVPRPWAWRVLARRVPQGGPPRDRARRARASPANRIPSPDRWAQVRHPVLPAPSLRASCREAHRTRVGSGRRRPPGLPARVRARPYPGRRLPGWRRPASRDRARCPPRRRDRPHRLGLRGRRCPPGRRDRARRRLAARPRRPLPQVPSRGPRPPRHRLAVPSRPP